MNEVEAALQRAEVLPLEPYPHLLPPFADLSLIRDSYPRGYCIRSIPRWIEDRSSLIPYGFDTTKPYVPLLVYINPLHGAGTFSYCSYLYGKRSMAESAHQLFWTSKNFYEAGSLPSSTTRFVAAKGVLAELKDNNINLLVVAAMPQESYIDLIRNPVSNGIINVYAHDDIKFFHAKRFKLFIKKSFMLDKKYEKIRSRFVSSLLAFKNDIVLVDDLDEMFFTVPQVPTFETLSERKQFIKDYTISTLINVTDWN